MRYQYDYSRAHVRDVFKRCRRLHVLVEAGFWSAGDAFLRRCYNGIGPDAWYPWLRKLITWLLAPFEIAALPHDYEFATAPRTYWHFTLANAKFAYNAALEAIDRDDIRLIWMGSVLAFLCQFGGWQGYKNTNIEDFKKCEN